MKHFLPLPIYIVAFGCLLATPLRAQAQERYGNPFDFPVLFSGNFGELRSNHFHGGLDFKTQGTTGKAVRASADGQITGIRVTHGSGYVLEVAYAHGYTAVYRHLSAFAGEIARRMEELQYSTQSWEATLTPAAGEYPVRRGEVIGYSGNTGYSFGPHLHFDLIETASGDYVDPLPFFQGLVKDSTAPRAEGFRLYPQPGLGVVNGLPDVQTFGVRTDGTITAWGLIGAGVRAFDYMEGARNRYGVHTVVLSVDSQEVFRSTVDRFASNENRQINSWNDHGYMKSFIDAGNRLRLLHAPGRQRGLVCIDEERPYRFVYTLRDALGNTARLQFTVQGVRTDTLPPVRHPERYTFRWNRVNVLHEPGLSVVVPRGNLYKDEYLHYALLADSGDIACVYRLNDVRIPLESTAEVSLALRRRPVADTTKYYLAGVGSRGKRYSLGGRLHGQSGILKGTIRELGTLTAAIDTVPPSITPVHPNRWARSGAIVYRLEDDETGIRSYRGTIDGEYALFGIPNAVQGRLVYRIDPRRIARGRHIVEITATDGCGNTTVLTTPFVY